MDNYIKFPLVSICIPTYNGEDYIEEALTSAINQTYPNYEIIISDDASTDQTLKLVKQAKEKTKIPFYIYHHIPKSIGANWNNCLIKSRGKYIKFLFQDDVLNRDCIEKMVDLAERDVDLGLIFCSRNFIYDKSNTYHKSWIAKFGNLHQHWINLKSINSGKKLLKKNKNLLHTPMNKVGEPSAVLIKKQVIEKVGLFNENMVQVIDFNLWYKIFKHYKIGFINEKLVSFRLHNNQATNIDNNKKLDYELYEKEVFNYLFFQLHIRVRIKLLIKKVKKIIF